MLSRNGGGGGELDDMDECQIESIGGQDEDDEEMTQAHASSSSPERWDVLGLGQAMVSFLWLSPKMSLLCVLVVEKSVDL